MPTVDSHLTIVRENLRTIEVLRAADPSISTWMVTVTFYAALHIVEAMFALDRQNSVDHTDDHQQRNQLLKRTNRYQKIYSHYQQLWNDSLIARYMHGTQGNQTFAGFESYMPLAKIESIHIRSNLGGIVKSARVVLNDDGFLADIFPVTR